VRGINRLESIMDVLVVAAPGGERGKGSVEGEDKKKWVGFKVC
jgi:hypothetical protein